MVIENFEEHCQPRAKTAPVTASAPFSAGWPLFRAAVLEPQLRSSFIGIWMFSGVRNPYLDEQTPDGGNQYSSTQNITAPESPSTTLSWETRVQCFVGCLLLSIISSFCVSTACS
ncbi:unnamed protein product [Cylicocyclus nassatus]|uniref:Uncharacterized protein n=1 Tax=Cylicocyclus nassatus TaxID=53992 RepID=A0AA36DUG0_CYLNA|nr:unnamed protein product [Cylicocyclus nassatus]